MVLFFQNFMKIKPSLNDEITLSLTDIGKSCLSREFLLLQKCLLRLFAKINLLQKFPNLQYSHEQDIVNRR